MLMLAPLASLFIGLLLILMRIAFITLYERKILALTQLRLGPNKVIFKGIVQPLIDGVKLLQKNLIMPQRAYKTLFLWAPFFVIAIIIFTWSCIPGIPFQLNYWTSILFLIVIFSVGVYGIFLIGWRASSKYAFIGRMRSCAQTVSYEVCLALVLFATIFRTNHPHAGITNSLFLLLGLRFWLISCLAETNRAPFDFAEGERELIRGLNIEHGSLVFAYIFVGEYGIVLCLSWITSLIWFHSSLLCAALCVTIFLLLRRTLPRFRYDKLIAFCWTRLLPTALLWATLRLLL